ncbi:MAG: DUF3135 domain-containing protein [Natronospirillum sp.]
MTLGRNRLPDFDTLREMAVHRPEALEELRTSLTEELLASVPENRRRRLQGTQFLIDMTRRRSKTPLQCCITLSRLMWDSVAELKSTVDGPLCPVKPEPPEVRRRPDSGRGYARSASNVVQLFTQGPPGNGSTKAANVAAEYEAKGALSDGQEDPQ